MRPPAAVSAMLIVSPRDLRREVTSVRIWWMAWGGKSGVEVEDMVRSWEGADGGIGLCAGANGIAVNRCLVQYLLKAKVRTKYGWSARMGCFEIMVRGSCLMRLCVVTVRLMVLLSICVTCEREAGDIERSYCIDHKIVTCNDAFRDPYPYQSTVAASQQPKEASCGVKRDAKR